MKQNPLNTMPNNEWEWFFETPNPLWHNDFTVLYLSFDNDLITLPIYRIILYSHWIAGKECFFTAYKWGQPY